MHIWTRLRSSNLPNRLVCTLRSIWVRAAGAVRACLITIVRWWKTNNAVLTLVSVLTLVVLVVQAVILWRQVDIMSRQTAISADQARLMQDTLKSQVEPEVDFWFDKKPGVGAGELVIRNNGAFRILDVSVDQAFGGYFRPPYNKPSLVEWRDLPPKVRTPWPLGNLAPGADRKVSINKEAQQAVQDLTYLPGRSESASPEGGNYVFLCFRLSYHREFDRKLFRKGVSVVVREQDGRPHLWELSTFLRRLRHGLTLPILEERAKEIFRDCSQGPK